MALVCQCPTCGLFVMSPPEASTEDQVRCPHCAATFILGDAAEISLPRLIRVQQKRQKSDAIIHDTAEEVPWTFWAKLVVDETSLEDEPVGDDQPHITSPEVHVVEPEPSDEGSFLTTAHPTAEASVHDDDSLLDFVIEGEEASKIFSKQELELAAEASTTEDEPTFDLAFDEALLHEEEADREASAETDRDEALQEVPDMFDFGAESGELEPDEFNIEPKEPQVSQSRADESRADESRADEPIEIPLVETQEQRPLPVMPNRNQPSRNQPSRNPMAAAVSRIGDNRRRKNRTLQSLMIGIAGLLLLATAYYGLNFFGGSEFNILGIPLPGCPHTYGDSTEVAAGDPLTEEVLAKQPLKENLARPRNVKFAPSEHRKSRLPESVTLYRPVRDDEPTEGIADSQAGSTTSSGEKSQTKTTSLFIDPDLFIPQINTDQPRAEFQLPQGAVGLASYPLFDVRELEATLNATHEEFGCPQCQSTGYLTSPGGKKVECDLCMGDPPNMMTTMGYRYFCQLGQAATLFTDDSPRAVKVKQQVDELLKKVVVTQREYRELGQLTTTKLEKPLHPYEGIMITGLVRVVKPNAGLYGAVIGLPDSDQRVTVISDRPFDFVAGDRVLLFGVTVLDPAKNIAGFQSEKPWIVWYGDSATLPETLP